MCCPCNNRLDRPLQLDALKIFCKARVRRISRFSSRSWLSLGTAANRTSCAATVRHRLRKTHQHRLLCHHEFLRNIPYPYLLQVYLQLTLDQAFSGTGSKLGGGGVFAVVAHVQATGWLWATEWQQSGNRVATEWQLGVPATSARHANHMPPARKGGPCRVQAKGCRGMQASFNAEHPSWAWRNAKQAGKLVLSDDDYDGVETEWPAGTDAAKVDVCGTH